MDLSPTFDSLKGKSMLITGCTGFLAKVFLEKVLRIQPDVKKLYLLMRAEDDDSASRRLQKDVISKQLFRVLRAKHGSGFHTFISEKLTAVSGDICHEDLGITDPDLRKEMMEEVNVVVNVAATVNFDDAYDTALSINTIGAKIVLEFAKKCENLELLLHVSTAYVAGEVSGIVAERQFKMGETINGDSFLDIDAELKLVEAKLKELDSEKVSKDVEIASMKELGMKRAKMNGWPNTYTFTKAMGEMLLGELRGDVPLVILRPTIITSTYKEPFPGWIEGTKTIDSLLISYGKGRLKCFLADPQTTMDVIPADMVVNSMVAAVISHSKQQSEFIYQVGSSVSNPVKHLILEDCSYRYFTMNPCTSKDGLPIKVSRVSILSSMEDFRKYMHLRYKLPLECLNLIDKGLCHLFRRRYRDMNRRYNLVMRLAELYAPFIFFQGRFDDSNTESLRRRIGEDKQMGVTLFFDPKCINWDNYFMKIHIPGLMKYVLR